MRQRTFRNSSGTQSASANQRIGKGTSYRPQSVRSIRVGGREGEGGREGVVQMRSRSRQKRRMRSTADWQLVIHVGRQQCSGGGEGRRPYRLPVLLPESNIFKTIQAGPHCSCARLLRPRQIPRIGTQNTVFRGVFIRISQYGDRLIC